MLRMIEKVKLNSRRIITLQSHNNLLMPKISIVFILGSSMTLENSFVKVKSSSPVISPSETEIISNFCKTQNPDLPKQPQGQPQHIGEEKRNVQMDAGGGQSTKTM